MRFKPRFSAVPHVSYFCRQKAMVVLFTVSTVPSHRGLNRISGKVVSRSKISQSGQRGMNGHERLSLLSARSAVTFPVAGHHRHLVSIKTYCSLWRRYVCASRFSRATLGSAARDSNSRPAEHEQRHPSYAGGTKCDTLWKFKGGGIKFWKIIKIIGNGRLKCTKFDSGRALPQIQLRKLAALPRRPRWI